MRLGAASRGGVCPRLDFLSRFEETLMRNLQIEELELVAGGESPFLTPGAVPPGFEGTKRAWENNGLGNYDQNAPGGSLPNNQAENFVGGGTTHTSGFPIQSVQT
jgi:hypothetical protein